MLKSGDIKPYGNHKGINVDLQNINDAFFIAQKFANDNPDHEYLDYNDIGNLLSLTYLFDAKLSSKRQRNWDERESQLDVKGLMEDWNFPDSIPGANRTEPREERESDDEIKSDQEFEDALLADLNRPESEMFRLSFSANQDPKKVDIKSHFMDSEFVESSKKEDYEKQSERILTVILYR